MVEERYIRECLQDLMQNYGLKLNKRNHEDYRLYGKDFIIQFFLNPRDTGTITTDYIYHDGEGYCILDQFYWYLLEKTEPQKREELNKIQNWNERVQADLQFVPQELMMKYPDILRGEQAWITDYIQFEIDSWKRYRCRRPRDFELEWIEALLRQA